MATSSPAASSDGPSRRRKAHSKSRNGCTQCKVKHYKCNEVYPTCSHCQRLNLTCSFGAPSPPVDQNSAAPKTLDIDDLRLLHNWHTTSTTPFSNHQEVKAARERYDESVELGLRHPYVLHALLAVSALQIYDKDPSEHKFYTQAAAHHGSALRLARPHVAGSNDEHAEGAFGFAAFNSLFAFAEPPLRHLDSGTPVIRDYIGDLIDTFKMCRGVRLVINSNEETLRESDKIGMGFWSYDKERVLPTLDAKYPPLKVLCDLVTEHVSPEKHEGVQQVIRELFIDMAILEDNDVNHSSASLIQRWIIGSDQAFMDLCEERHPVALIVLAHYGAMVSLRTNMWFFRRWPPIIFQTVQDTLEQQWQKYIEWPRSRIIDAKNANECEQQGH